MDKLNIDQLSKISCKECNKYLRIEQLCIYKLNTACSEESKRSKTMIPGSALCPWDFSVWEFGTSRSTMAKLVFWACWTSLLSSPRQLFNTPLLLCIPPLHLWCLELFLCWPSSFQINFSALQTFFSFLFFQTKVDLCIFKHLVQNLYFVFYFPYFLPFPLLSPSFSRLWHFFLGEVLEEWQGKQGGTFMVRKTQGKVISLCLPPCS